MVEDSNTTLRNLAYLTTIFVGLTVLTPYVWTIPKDNSNLITQGQTTLYAGWMVIIAFYYKSRINNPQDAATINTQANTINQAQAALNAVTGASPGQVNLKPGDEVKVAANDTVQPDGH